MPEDVKGLRIYFRKIRSGPWLRGLVGAWQKNEREENGPLVSYPSFRDIYIWGNVQTKVIPRYSCDYSRPLEISPRWEKWFNAACSCEMFSTFLREEKPVC